MLFVVIAAALLISWVVAVLFAPLLGVKILPKAMKHHNHAKPGHYEFCGGELYNGRRPHSSLDRKTPDQAYFDRLPQTAAA